MRMPQFRIRTLMISIAFVALLLTVAYQTVLLRRAAVREAVLQAIAEEQRAAAERALAAAEAQNAIARAADAKISALRDSFREQRKP